MPDRIVSVSIGENYVRIVEGNNIKDQMDITAMGQMDSPFPFYDVMTDKVIEDESKIIMKLFDSLKIKTKNINVIIPDSVSFSQILEMPKLKEKELLSAIKYQADQFIPMPLEETALDLEILKEDNATKKLLVLIVATPQVLVNKIETLIEKSGLLPDSVENELSASTSFFSTFYKPTVASEGTIFVSFGPAASSLYFFHHGYNVIIESHTFKLGYNLFVKEVQTNLNIDEKKIQEALSSIGLGAGGSINLDQILKPVVSELIREIEKFAISMKEKYKIAKIGQILLFNKAQEIIYLDKKVESFLSTPTHIFDANPYIKQTPLTQSYSSKMSSYVSTLGGCTR